MRSIIVAGVLLAAGPVLANDFGLDLKAARKALTEVIQPRLTEVECDPEVCTFESLENQIQVNLHLGKDQSVQSVGITFSATNWAIAAAYGRSVQRLFFVPERSIAGLDDIARRAATGTAGYEVTAAVSCTGKQISGIPFLTCSRK